MHIIYFDRHSKRHTLKVSNGYKYAALASSILGIIFLFWLGYYLGSNSNIEQTSQRDWVDSWRQELGKQKKDLDNAKSENQMNLDAFTEKVAKLQAHVARLEALGIHLGKIANIDDDLFNFSASLSENDLHDINDKSNDNESNGTIDFFKSFDSLHASIENLDNQLNILQTLLKSQKLDQQTLVKGKPIAKGYISSYFGYRNHPINKTRLLHKGVDFVSKEGTPILSVASGVVTWASDNGGYGKMIEINHGDGYSTRYAHNSNLLVQVGDLVNRGDKIAEMGSTGHSTGTHVHFEVWNKGRPENPITYLTKK